MVGGFFRQSVIYLRASPPGPGPDCLTLHRWKGKTLRFLSVFSAVLWGCEIEA